MPSAMQVVQPRFDDGHLTALEARHPRLVHIHAQHVVAHVGEAGGAHQAHVTAAVYRYLHRWLLSG